MRRGSILDWTRQSSVRYSSKATRIVACRAPRSNMRRVSSLTGPRRRLPEYVPRALTTCLIVRQRRAVRGGRPPPALDAPPGGGLRVRLRARSRRSSRATRPTQAAWRAGHRRRARPRAATPRSRGDRRRAAGTARRAARSHRGSPDDWPSRARSRSSPGSRPGCSAVRCSRCSRQRRRSGWRNACRASTASRRCRCSGSTPRTTTGRKSVRARSSTRS